MTRRDILLVTVGCLIVVRFIIVPLSELNKSLNLEIESKKIIYQKGQELLATRESVVGGLAEINTDLKKYNDRFPTMDSVETAQLEIQRRITSLAKEYNVIIESAQWISTSNSNPVGVDYEIYYKSTLNDFIKWHLAIEGIGNWISASSIQLSTSKQNIRIKRQGDAKGVITVKALFISKGLKDEK